MLNQTQLNDCLRLLKDEQKCISCGKWIHRSKLVSSRCLYCHFQYCLDEAWNETAQQP